MSVQFIHQKKVIQIPCLRQLNLLGHAQIEELDIGSQCGGHGICGRDRIRILKGESLLSKVTEKERQHLTSEEILQGWRLGCQSWPESDDVEIQVSTHADPSQ